MSNDIHESLFALPDSMTKLRVEMMELVPTVPGKPLRDWGKYESANLPNIDLLLERTLNDIKRAYEIRGRGHRSFHQLWSEVCKGLVARKNATSFEHWKSALLAKKVIKAKAELGKKVGALLAKRFSIDRQNDPELGQECDDAFENASREYNDFDSRFKASTDDTVDVAIAYWIEAANARKSNDDLRCLHALIECWTNIGITRSAKTESEAKSAAGAKQGKDIRDAVASMVAIELNALEITKQMTHPESLIGNAVKSIQANPLQAEILAAYDRQATAGKKSVDKPVDRICASLMRWATAKEPQYPELATAFEQALQRLHAFKKRKARK